LVQVRGNDFDQDWFDPRMSAFLQAALGRADVIGAVAPEMVDRIQALYPGRDVRFLPNGIDVAEWQRLPHEARRGSEIRGPLAAEGRRVVGLFGEWKYKKRLPAWLAAVRGAGLNDRIALLIVGTLDDECRQLLDDPVLAPRHRRLEFSAREELPGLYAACDFLVLPSLYEGMPNVVLEAMACGVVPLVSRAGALEVMVRDGETGFVFQAEDRQSMAESLGRALALGAGEYQAMSGRATAFVAEHFSVEKELAAVLSVFGRRGEPSSCT
jgi:glycosyltransferase involved in cell wall biosynthesis